MIESGQVVKTASGRNTSPAPKIDATTERKTNASLKRLHAWLRQEAINECTAIGNYFARRQMEAIDINNISPSDVECMNMILFDKEFSPMKCNKDPFDW